MAGYYQIRQGDHVSRIATAFGFTGHNGIWNHPNNADLKSARQTPHVLLPGDKLFIPDRETREEPRPTDKRHQFVAHRDSLMLLIALQDNDFEPISGANCELRVESDTVTRATDSSGLLQKPIKSTDANGSLVVSLIHVAFRIGDLDPVEYITGQQARLNNLGYAAGSVEAKLYSDQMRSAVEEFQCDHNLPVDGICGRATQDKLKEIHGC